MDVPTDWQVSETAQKLIRSFMQLKRAEWQRSVDGCKPSEIRVLLCLKRGSRPGTHEMKVSEISKLLRVTPPTITQLIKGLEANGLLERHIDPVDRRAVAIILTAKGEKVTRQAEEAFFTSINGLIAYLGEEKSNHLAELLSEVVLYYNEKAVSAYHAYEREDEEA